LKEYVTISEGTYQFKNDQGQVDTVVYSGLIGTKADGSKEILAFKFSDNPNLIKLSSSEIKGLSKDACIGRMNGCFEEGYVGNGLSHPIVDVFAKSTGKVESFEKMIGGEKFNIQSVLMVTQTIDGFPRLMRVIVQVENGNNPGVDLFENVRLWQLGLVPDLSNTVRSVQEWENFALNGKNIELTIDHDIEDTNLLVEGFGSFQDKLIDINYLTRLQLFLDSKGINQQDGSLIFLPQIIKFVN
jgi:hypothetical protein